MTRSQNNVLPKILGEVILYLFTPLYTTTISQLTKLVGCHGSPILLFMIQYCSILLMVKVVVQHFVVTLIRLCSVLGGSLILL